MAEAIPPLTVDIIFNTSGVNAGVAKANEGLTKITAQTKSVTSSMGNLKTMMLGVFGGNIATQGFMAIERALIESKQEFFETEVANQRLSQALDNMGVSAKKTHDEIQKNVDAYAQLGFQGAESANAMGTLVTATNSVEQATKLMAMAADLARYKHIDLGTAATILARGTQGSAKAFKELGITLDTTVSKNKAISKAFDQLNAKIGGQAVAYTKTFEGQMAVLKERMQELFNVIAVRVIPVLNYFFGLINAGMQWVQKNSGALKVFTALLVTYAAVTSVAAIATWGLDAALSVLIFALESPIVAIVALAAGFVYLWNHWKTFRETMAETAATIVYAISSLILAHARLFAILGKLPGVGGFFKTLAKDAENASKKLDGVATSIDKLKTKKITGPKIPSIAGVVPPGGKTGIIGNVPGSDKGGAGGATTVQYVTVYASNTNDIYKNLSKAAKNGVPVGGK